MSPISWCLNAWSPNGGTIQVGLEIFTLQGSISVKGGFKASEPSAILNALSAYPDALWCKPLDACPLLWILMLWNCKPTLTLSCLSHDVKSQQERNNWEIFMVHTREATEWNPGQKLKELWPTRKAIPERQTFIQECLTGVKSLLKYTMIIKPCIESQSL